MLAIRWCGLFGASGESDEAAQARVGQLRCALAGVADGAVGTAMSKVDPDGVIAFVGHACIFHKLLGRWVENCAPSEVGLVDGKIAEIETPVNAAPLPQAADPDIGEVAEAETAGIRDGDALPVMSCAAHSTAHRATVSIVAKSVR